jgi:hypothetical protein
MRIRTQCRECGLPYSTEFDRDNLKLECPNCQHEVDISPEGWTETPKPLVERCPVCDCKHLYRQRDFNRGLGCLLVVIGAILVPWTYGLSLIVLSAVDFFIYRKLQLSTVCYVCDTVFRDVRPTDRQGEFDLLKHDVLKYGKSWDSE